MATPAAAAADAAAVGSTHAHVTTGESAKPAAASIASGRSSPAALVSAALPHMQESMAGLTASLGKHEHVIARLRQQLNESLAQHQQKLTQELARIIQATAAQAAAGASAGAAAGAAASAAAAMGWAQAAAAAACGSAGVGEQGVASTHGSSSKACSCKCTCAVTATGAAATATVNSHGVTGSSNDVFGDGSGPQQRWDAASLRAQLQLATAHMQLLQSQLQSAEAKLAMHRAAAVAAKQRIDSLEGLLMQLQQHHSSKVLQTLPGVQQLPEAAAAVAAGGVQHAADCGGGDACCCGSAWQDASADGCASQATAAAAAGWLTLNSLQEQQQQQHLGWELALSPRHAPGMLHQQQQLLRLQDQLRMAICDNTVLCYECMHLQHLLVQERLVGRSACQVGNLLHGRTCRRERSLFQRLCRVISIT
jgi:hypothetical protein